MVHTENSSWSLCLETHTAELVCLNLGWAKDRPGDRAVVGGVQDTRKGSKIKTKTTMEKEDTLPGDGSPPPDPGCRRSPRELWGAEERVLPQ